ncbi:MAG: hypothetical protein ACRYG7_20270 [Janthinobacterium lividum]
MNPIQELNLELFTDYFQFYIQDEQAVGDLGEDWTDEAVDRLLATTAGTIGVGTMRNMDAPVSIKLFDSEPSFIERDDIGQVNECDLEITSGKAVIAGCTDYFPDAQRLDLTNGIYRARIYYSNLDKISEDGLDGEDYYEVHLWLTNKSQATNVLIARATSRT